jgi:hypothetical protein
MIHTAVPPSAEVNMCPVQSDHTDHTRSTRCAKQDWEKLYRAAVLVHHPQNRIIPARIFLRSLAENGASLGSDDGLLCDLCFASRFWAGFTLNTK